MTILIYLFLLLLYGVADITSQVTHTSTYWLGDEGGIIFYIYGTGFSIDQFSQFDPSKGNKVSVINEKDVIEFNVITQKSTAEKLTCETERYKVTNAPRKYKLVVFSDQNQMTSINGSADIFVEFATWFSPKIRYVNPNAGLPFTLLKYSGWFHADQLVASNKSSPLTSTGTSFNSKRIKSVFMGIQKHCEMADPKTEKLYGVLTSSNLICKPLTQQVGPMNASMFVVQRGASAVDKWGMYVDSKDVLHQYFTYGGVDKITPATGATTGGSIIEIEGTGFNTVPGYTKVYIGGAECIIIEITFTKIYCITPSQSDTGAAQGERGLKYETFEGVEMTLEKDVHDSWDSLDSTNSAYNFKVFKEDMLDYTPLTGPSSSRLSGYMTVGHNGWYLVGINTDNSDYHMYISRDGTLANREYIAPWALFEVEADTPLYFEFRFIGATMNKTHVYWKDLHTPISYSQSREAHDEQQRLRIINTPISEMHEVEVNGTGVMQKLFFNGMKSSQIDVTDPDAVLEALNGLTKAQCEFSVAESKMIYITTYEEDGGDLPPRSRGDVVQDKEAYCGRYCYQTSASNPTLIDTSDKDEEIDANVYRYACMAMRTEGAESTMLIRFTWIKNGKEATTDITFDHPFKVDGDSWDYNCIDMQAVSWNSYINDDRKNGTKLNVRILRAPYPSNTRSYVYVDQLSFSKEEIIVDSRMPSSLASLDILISDIQVVQPENSTTLQITYNVANCQNGIPLIGLDTGEETVSSLSSKDTATFNADGGSWVVTRDTKGSGRLTGTWDMEVLGTRITNLDPYIGWSDFQNELRNSLGDPGINVKISGDCKMQYRYVEWTRNPGTKEFITMDTTNLIPDGGTTVSTQLHRSREGQVWKDPARADGFTTYQPPGSLTVAIWINDYATACTGDCSYIYDDSNIAALTSMTKTPDGLGGYSFVFTGTGFAGSLVDFSVMIGSYICNIDGVTAPTEVSCTVEYLPAGVHIAELNMQPVGFATQPNPPLTVDVSLSITSATPSSGGKGGGIDVVLAGSALPESLEGWADGSVTFDGNDCPVSAADKNSVTCKLPAGTVGAVDVVASVPGSSSTLSSGFLYIESASIASVDPVTASSILGGETFTIEGLNFGNTPGVVKVGMAVCETLTWTDTTITATMPENAPGSYSVSVYIDATGYASNSPTITYTFEISSTSSLIGSIHGGTIVYLQGTGIGTNCSDLTVIFGENMACDVQTCSDTEIMCKTRHIPTQHVITAKFCVDKLNWSPSVAHIEVGDTVLWTWTKADPLSQVLLNVFQVDSTQSFEYDGVGIYSGPPTPSGNYEVTFLQSGKVLFASDEDMIGRVIVNQPIDENKQVMVYRNDVEATYVVNPNDADLPVEVPNCPVLKEDDITGCNETQLNSTSSDSFYFRSSICRTPEFTEVSASSTETIPGLNGLLVRANVTLTITGSGFGDAICQVNVMVGKASCTVTAVTSTSITCTLDNQEDLCSLERGHIEITVINRGTASDALPNADPIIAIAVINSISPTEGSTEGNTLLTITGTSLHSFDDTTEVKIGSKTCEVIEVTYDTITCLTPPGAEGDAVVRVTESAHQISAISDPADIKFIYSSSSTPTVTTAVNLDGIVTITGSNFGTDLSTIEVDLITSETVRRKRELQEEEKLNAINNLNIDTKSDEEIFLLEHELAIKSNIEQMLAYDAEDEEPRNNYVPKVRRHRFDQMEKLTDFWGKFTRTSAKNFKESVEMGAWRTMRRNSPVVTDDLSTEFQSREKREIPSNAYTCIVTSLTETEIVCDTSNMPGGSYQISIINTLGSALIPASATTLALSSSITTISPVDGSINGGATVMIDGTGFNPDSIAVKFDGVECPIISDPTTTQLICVAPPHAAGSVTVEVTSAGVAYPSPTNFQYTDSKTPSIVSASSPVTPGSSLTLTGDKLDLSGSSSVSVGGYDCVVTAASTTDATCTAPDLASGTYEVIASDSMYGASNNDQTVVYEHEISTVLPSTSGFGGSEITIAGLGFEPSVASTVTVCDEECVPISGTSSSIICTAPPITSADATVPCDVTVSNTDGSNVTSTSGFIYDSSLSATVTLVTPTLGGTAGGTTVTISGTGFAASGNEVNIDGSICIISTEAVAEITCVTEAHAHSGRYPVVVKIPGSGNALPDPDTGNFFYTDRWSSFYTWDNQPPPGEGEFVIITEDITLDASTEVLKFLLIDGATLTFDPEASEELILRTEYILIIGGGALQIGTEEDPYPGKAVIELYGNAYSIELPIYGAKVLAVRNGTLDLHGRKISQTWTRLNATANPGDTSIALENPVNWLEGDEIVIATTEHMFSKNENEKHVITSVSDDGLSVSLVEPIKYEHVSMVQTLGGREVETRAEVGLLSRNVKIRGNINTDYTVEYVACDEEFRPGQFSTLSCLHGKFGEELSNDDFGAAVMLFGKFPDIDLVVGHIENVEVTHGGQAFQFGRYPLHFHLVGNVSHSYIRGCSVHKTFNRAITIHSARHLRVENNVVYDNMGHAIFTEDGNEIHNTIAGNLVIDSQFSMSLLNADTTPASIWIVNPNNDVYDNAVAGGTHFGFWYRFERHPTGPSATNDICQNNEPLGIFRNNTAHSFGRYGFWLFSMDGYFPRLGTCGGQKSTATFQDFTAYRCERGAEIVFGGALILENFVVLDNEESGLEMVEVSGGFGSDDGPAVTGSLVIGNSALGSGGLHASGIILPKKEIFSVTDTTFVNFSEENRTALSGCSQCKVFQGACRTAIKNLTFENAVQKVMWKWEHENWIIDSDGSISGTAENKLVPASGILPSGNCYLDGSQEFSVKPGVQGAICDSTVEFVRVAMHSPSPSSLVGADLHIYDQDDGETTIPYRLKRILKKAGWMGLLVANRTYTILYNGSELMSNISYSMEVYPINQFDYLIFEHVLPLEPDGVFTTTDERNGSLTPLDPATAVHGDYHWDNDTSTLTYFIAATSNSQRRSRPRSEQPFDNLDVGEKVKVEFTTYRCKFVGCVAPTSPPIPTGRPDAFIYWSDVETWKFVPVGSGGHPSEDTYGLPVEGDHIVIPGGIWIIVDVAIPPLGNIYVYGGLEFADTMNHELEAEMIYIHGGSVVAGYSKEAPFTNKLKIKLTGTPNTARSYQLPGTPNLGWKAIGVYGALRLHGTGDGSTWIKLVATAAVASTELHVAPGIVDEVWLNKQVVVTSTSKEASESELVTVTGISGNVLTIDPALQYEHLGQIYAACDGSYTYHMMGEVGLISRNIVIEGAVYPNQETEGIGGRVLVGSLISGEGLPYTGSAQLSNVEFQRMGHQNMIDSEDPRYSIAFNGIGTSDGSSYVHRCALNHNYNIAIGLFNSHNISIEENVIHHAVASGIIDESNDNTHRSNLVAKVLFPGTLNGQFQIDNKNWYAAMDLRKAQPALVADNVIAGTEQVGYQTYGELCDQPTVWGNNEVHSALIGVMGWKKVNSGSEECRRFNNFYVWRSWDAAFYLQSYSSFVVTDVTVVDCTLGVNQLVYFPRALDHEAMDKTASVTNSLFVGASPSHTCEYQSSKALIFEWADHGVWKSGKNHGYSAIASASHMSGPNMAPKHPLHKSETYPSLYGASYVENVTFANYAERTCGSDIAIITNAGSEDAIHPMFTSELQFCDTPEDNKLFIHKPSLARVNPSDCVDMDCDGLRKVVITDRDGTYLGAIGATATSVAETEWDGDASHGLGDYRIPVPLQMDLDGVKIDQATKFPNKGIVRDNSCTKIDAWQAWKCTAMKHRMLIIESMDADTEIRRLSPIALIANPGSDGYVDLVNGPMDRGWCFGYTCQERISTFNTIVAIDYTYEMAYTSTPCQHSRFHLLHSDPTDAVVFRLFFPKSQRYDVYVDGIYVPPTNIDSSADSYQLIPEDPDSPTQFYPTKSSIVGANYLERNAKLLHFVIKGGSVLDVITTPIIILNMGIVVSEDDFFEENIVANLAGLLGVDPKNIRVTYIVREDSGRRRRRDVLVPVDVQIELGSAAKSSLDEDDSTTTSSGGEVLSFDNLETMEKIAAECAQLGRCKNITIEIKSLIIDSPQKPPTEPGPKLTEEMANIISNDSEPFSVTQQILDMEALNESLEATTYDKPASSKLISEVKTEWKTLQQGPINPKINIYDVNGKQMIIVGHHSDPPKFNAKLVGDSNGKLIGKTYASFVEGQASFSNLVVSRAGEYTIEFSLMGDVPVPKLDVALGYTFSVEPTEIKILIRSTPKYLNADKYFGFNLVLVEEGTNNHINRSLLQGYTMTGTIGLWKPWKMRGELTGKTSFSQDAGDRIDLNGLQISKPGAHYIFNIRIAIPELDIKVRLLTDKIKVLERGAVIPEDAIQKSITLTVFYGKPAFISGKEEVFKYKVLDELLQKAGFALWTQFRLGPITRRKRPIVKLLVQGSKEQIYKALDALCEKIKENKMKVRLGKQLYILRKLKVDGTPRKCKPKPVKRLDVSFKQKMIFN